MVFLLVLTVLLIVPGGGFLVVMLWRDEPPLGVAGLCLLIAAGIPASAYGVLSST